MSEKRKIMRIFISLVLVLGFVVPCAGQTNCGKNSDKGILFEVYNVFVAKRPHDINDINNLLAGSADYNCAEVEEANGLNRQSIFGKPDEDIAYVITFSFNAETAGQWEFALSYDAGIASALIIDEKVVMFSDLDIWASYEKPIITAVELKKGLHNFKFVALENCCGSPIRLGIKGPSEADFKVISTTNLAIGHTTAGMP
ncbi:MAG TPA: hypothetical protein VIK28_00035 [Sedimentisphaerales bacterium]